MSPDNSKHAANKRTVCDHCRRRRIRCDGEFPCNQCNNAALSCKREHVPKRRGPKRGSGRVINELRAQEETPKIKIHTRDSSNGTFSSGPPSIDNWLSDHSASTSPTIPQHPKWHPIMSDVSQFHDEPANIFSSDQTRPSSQNYFHLIPTCIDLFMEHIYPIMPLVHMPTLREFVARRPEMFEKNLLYSLCALTSTHMSGKSILAPGPPSWEAAGRFFLDECISIRQQYDFVEDKTLSAVISSYFVSTAFFELNQSRKSWYYLREALTMGQDLKFHDENAYVGLAEAEALCRRRTFWILYVTERSFAILRHKPLTLSKTPAYPTTIHDYESPSIHTGFMHLVNSYHLLDNSFVESWNEASNPTNSMSTYTTLQTQLSKPFSASPALPLTDIQKADILVTQQWLRLIVWQSSMRQGLLSSTSETESMTFSYPMKIAESLLGVISSLPEKSIEVHGMGIMEKIFEIGNSMLDVMHAYGQSLPPLEESYGIGVDPFAFFIKTLSRTPNSQKQYANLLLQKAAEKPEILRFSTGLGIQISDPSGGPQSDAQETRGTAAGPLVPPNSGSLPLASPVPTRQWRGSIVGEIDDNGNYTVTADSDSELDGSATWGADAVWISDPTASKSRDRIHALREESGIDGLRQVNAKNVFIGASGGAEALSELDAMMDSLERVNTLHTDSSIESMIEDQEAMMVIDDRDDDIDWGFAVKLEV